MPYKDKKTRLDYQQTARKNRRKAGVCTRCSGPLDSLYMDCEKCRKRSNSIVRKIVKQNLKEGKCQCGRTRVRLKLVCKRCADDSKRRQRELKIEVIEGYGGVCACCSTKVWEFLSVDHTKNDGAALRERRGGKETSTTLYRRIIKEGFPTEYQILCYNCNLNLGFFGYCPHRPEIKRMIIRKWR